MGKGATAPWKCCKVLFVLQLLCEVAEDEVFMHHFEKISSASAGFAPARPPPVEKILWAPMALSTHNTKKPVPGAISGPIIIASDRRSDSK